MTDATGPIPADLRALLEAEKSGGEAPDGARERVLLRLVGTFGLGVAGGLAAGAPAKPAGSSGGTPAASSAAGVVHAARASRLLQAAALFLTGAGAGAGGYHLSQRARHPTTAVARRLIVETPRSDLPPPTPTVVVPVVVPVLPPVGASAARARPPTVKPRAPAASSAPEAGPEDGDQGLAAERTLLEIARTALARGQGEDALTALRSHARQFPSGELAEEREGLLVEALVVTRKYDLARERAARFKKRYPLSLFAPVVEQALQSIP